MEITGMIPSSRTGCSAAGKAAAGKGWKLSESLREKIGEYAKEDAAQNVYMGDKFLALRKREVARVAPNRAALMGKISRAMSLSHLDDMKKIREADERLLCMLFGEPYEAKLRPEETGTAIHVYDSNGDEILTYTAGTGWHEKESKPETEVHSALKAAYYDAYCTAKQQMKKAAPTGVKNAQKSLHAKA
ncbi:MAG: hypothetical protein HFG27_07550 [Provencibacterium sp.]|nr:hypothetical protein [Provencibacterium sp.]